MRSYLKAQIEKYQNAKRECEECEFDAPSNRKLYYQGMIDTYTNVIDDLQAALLMITTKEETK